MLNSISLINQKKVAFKGDSLDKPQDKGQDVAQNKNNSWMLWTGLTALGAVGIYLATRGRRNGAEVLENAKNKGEDIANNAADSVKEEAKKVLEKLPSRKEVLESLGIKFNDEKFLIITKKGADGKEVEELYNGTYSYTARNGVNIKERISDGVVSRREMYTQKTIDNPVIKDYEYYRGQNLRGIRTIRKADNISLFVSKDQKSLQDLRASLNYLPKTDDEIKALNAQGIKYELAEEVTNFGQYGDRKNIKEIYTYPDDYPIATKEVYYGDRHCTSNEGKEITLTFREPQQTRNPHYKADGFKLDIRKYGFSSELLGDYNFDNFENLYDISVIPFNFETKAYKEIKEVLEQEYSVDALKKIRYGHN